MQATGPSQGGNIVGLQRTETSTVARTAMAVNMDRPASIQDFYQTADGANYYPALLRALNGGCKHVHFPAGTYTLNSKLNIGAQSGGNQLYTGITISGESVAADETHGGISHLICPNGFLYNSFLTTPADKAYCTLSTLYIDGGVGNTPILLDGAIGGRIDSCVFDHFSTAVSNPSGFLTQYTRCVFINGTGWGLSLADTNQTVIQNCMFTAFCRRHITTRVVAPLASGGGPDGEPMLIQSNLHNTSDNFNFAESLVWISGLIDFSSNYFEVFGTATTNKIMVNITSTSSLKAGFRFCNNLVGGGGGKAAIGLQLNSSTGGDTLMCGEVSGNQMSGFNKASIWYGDVAGTNNQISGVRIYDNYYGNGEDSDSQVLNMANQSIYAPLSTSHSAPSLNVSGTTFVPVNIASGVDIDLSNSLSNSRWLNWMYYKNTGFYELDCVLTSTSASTSAAFFTSTSDSGPWTQIGPEIVVGVSGCIKWTAKLQYADRIRVQARNGGTINGVFFSAKYIGDRLS